MRKTTRLLLVIVTWLLSAGNGHLQAQDEQEEQSYATVRGVILGADGTPLAGVTVHIDDQVEMPWIRENREPRPEELEELSRDMGFQASVKTKEDGSFLFEKVPPGKYIMAEISRRRGEHDAIRDWLAPVEFSLSAREELDLGVLRLKPAGAVLQGTVMCKGKPVEGAVVGQWFASLLSLGFLDVSKPVQTDSKGKYVLPVRTILSNDSDIYIRCFAPQAGYVIRHVILDPTAVVTLDIELPGDCGNLTVKLKATHEKPEGCRVWLYRSNSRSRFSDHVSLVPDEHLSVHFQELPAGDWDVHAEAKGYPPAHARGIRVEPDKTVQLELTFSKEDVSAVSGKVRLLRSGESILPDPKFKHCDGYAVFLVSPERRTFDRHPPFALLSDDYSSFKIETVAKGEYVPELWSVSLNMSHGIWERRKLLRRLPPVHIQGDKPCQLDFGNVKTGRDRFDPAKVEAFLEKWRPRLDREKGLLLEGRIREAGILQVYDELMARREVTHEQVAMLKINIEYFTDIKAIMREPEDIEWATEIVESLQDVLSSWKRR